MRKFRLLPEPVVVRDEEEGAVMRQRDPFWVGEQDLASNTIAVSSFADTAAREGGRGECLQVHRSQHLVATVDDKKRVGLVVKGHVVRCVEERVLAIPVS